MATRQVLAKIAREEAEKHYHGIIPNAPPTITEIIFHFPNWPIDQADGLWCAAFVYHCVVKSGFQIPVRPKECVSCNLAGCGGISPAFTSARKIIIYVPLLELLTDIVTDSHDSVEGIEVVCTKQNCCKNLTQCGNILLQQYLLEWIDLYSRLPRSGQAGQGRYYFFLPTMMVNQPCNTIAADRYLHRRRGHFKSNSRILTFRIYPIHEI